MRTVRSNMCAWVGQEGGAHVRIANRSSFPMVSVIARPMSAARRANSPRGFLGRDDSSVSSRWCAFVRAFSFLETAVVSVWNSEVRSCKEMAMLVDSWVRV
jgi:hypothetical protein